MSYFLFAGDKFYPKEGLENYHGSYKTLDEAKDAGIKLRFDWFQVVVLQGDELVIAYAST